MSFVLDLKKFGADTMEQATTVVRKVSTDILSSVIFRTPVDTGRARANWQVGVGRYSPNTIQQEDKQGASTLGKGKSTIDATEAGDKIYLINNLPYIQALEDGHSKQSPQGMVALTLQEYDNK
jgi:hypothetical protein